MENKLVFEASLRFNSPYQKKISVLVIRFFIQALKNLFQLEGGMIVNAMLVVYEDDKVTRHLGSEKTFAGIEQELQDLTD